MKLKTKDLIFKIVMRASKICFGIFALAILVFFISPDIALALYGLSMLGGMFFLAIGAIVS